MTPISSLSRRTIALTSVGLVAGALLATSALPSAHAVPPTPGTIQLIDVSSVPGIASTNSESYASPSVSADGRFVAFASTADDIIPTGESHTDGPFQVFIRDTVTDKTKSIGVYRSDPVISDDGQVVASRWGNNVWVWSEFTGTSRLVNTRYGSTTEPGNDSVISLDMSGSANAIVYETAATDVLPGEAYEVARPRVYKIDPSGVTSLVGFDPMVDASDPSISADGRFVAFTSTQTHAALPSNGHRQVYVSDTVTGRIDVVSLDSSGVGLGDGDSAHPSISADGMSVAFDSSATNLQTTAPRPGTYVYTRDRATGLTTMTSLTAAGAPRPGKNPSVSSDGTVVAYEGLTCSPICQVYVNNTATGASRVASTNRLPEPGNQASWAPAVSADGKFVSWATGATNLTSDDYSRPSHHHSLHVLLRNLGASGAAVRAAGADRYETAVKVSEGAFAEGAGTVYLAAGANYPDALSGAPAAGEAGGPVLLTEKDRVPASVQAEIDRLSPERVVILGGTNSVSTGVEAAVAAEGRTVERIGGTDRYEVSAAVAADSFGSATTVYVASGEKAPDALSGAAAAGKDSPVLLTKKDELPQTVRDEIVALGPEKIIILGGTETIGETVALELAEIADTVRVSGADRYETSAAVADEAFVENTGGAVYIASGETFPDALTGSAAAIAAGAPVLLVQKDSIPIDIGETLERLGPSAVYVLGGPDTVSDTVVEILGSYVHDIDD
ncbi:cell wall-binding repeat-containing protein [Herbiconiux sp. KACC 21604]|uniref:cell wall-binding repeat-containing protein n=1 Tax=Herbiconiux sp. KACC 21604 TaxID=3092664 RepID=UPI0014918FDA|nr:hypothetical protein HL652_15195 [Herbiconiux sp. SALV-R1]WPO85945.1 cell wall-binding repeat-containing protein [Herbiconiux sp. KACC 21604]